MEEELLEKIDVIRNRLGVSYREAREALEETRGDLLEALIMLEERHQPVVKKLDHVKDEAMDRLKGFLKKGVDSKIRIKKDDKTLVEIPATWGVAGLAGTLMRTELAFLGLVGTATALAKRWNIEVVKNDKKEKNDQSKSVPVEEF